MPRIARSSSFRTIPALLLAAALCSSPASAQPLVYDGFDDAPGQGLAGLGGGQGWAGPWADLRFNGPCTIGTGTLALDALVTLGNRASIPGPFSGFVRYLAQPVGQSGSTTYISFLLRPITGVAGSNAYGGVVLGSSAAADSLFVGKGGAFLQYALETNGGSGIAPTQTFAVEGQTVLLVVRVSFDIGTESIDLWVNPPVGTTPPPVPDATKSDLELGSPDYIQMISGDGLVLDLDELRLGTTYASVMPQNCYANCDASTSPPILNVNDFQCFLNAFAAADPYANCDQSATPPILNVNDFQCFLNTFAAGCS